jgi:predicted nucleic acid-binding protein
LRRIRPRLVDFRTDFQNRVHQLIAPDVLLSEVAHALTRAERRGFISTGQAEPLLLDIMTTSPQLHLFTPLLLRAVRISSQTRSATTDCLYIALAEREKCDLITADQRLVNNLGAGFPFIKHLATMP